MREVIGIVVAILVLVLLVISIAFPAALEPKYKVGDEIKICSENPFHKEWCGCARILQLETNKSNRVWAKYEWRQENQIDTLECELNQLIK